MAILRRSKSSNSTHSNLFVEIYKHVIDRIYDSVSHSNIEEGGKFLGTIEETEHGRIIKVATYIDSGPKVDNSSVHLHPDGEYQEEMFRLTETFYPSIEHLGSWHSHHCNGCNDLSGGDINGYRRSVNNPQYNLNHFFVLLVTDLVDQTFEARYYLFTRGTGEHGELNKSQVKIVDGRFPLESLLRESEKASFQYRLKRDPSFEITQQTHINETEKNYSRRDPMKKIRADDHQWISQRFPQARAFQNKQDQTICWKWSIEAGEEAIDLRYKHTNIKARNGFNQANLEILYKDIKLFSEYVTLDHARFDEIEHLILRAKSKIKQGRISSKKQK